MLKKISLSFISKQKDFHKILQKTEFNISTKQDQTQTQISHFEIKWDDLSSRRIRQFQYRFAIQYPKSYLINIYRQGDRYDMLLGIKKTVEYRRIDRHYSEEKLAGLFKKFKYVFLLKEKWEAGV